MLFKFENKLREFIKNKLIEYYSKEKGYSKGDWYLKGIPKSILERIKEEKDNPNSFLYKVKIEYPIEYLNIPDYKRIIETNWNNIFGKKFKNKGLLTKIKQNLENLIIPRNKIAHFIRLPEDDIKILENSCVLIKNTISKL